MSDYIKNNFLPADHEKAIEEIDCYYYNNQLSKDAIRNNQISKAVVYLENSLRSLKVVEELREKHDKAWFINKRIEADQTMKELVQKQLVKAYD